MNMSKDHSTTHHQNRDGAISALARNGVDVLDDIAAFIRRYLVCDDHQLTLLTLWSACTHCYQCFFTAPYLHVASPLPQSGKSLCLSLLWDLSDAPTAFFGVPGPTLLDRLLQGRSLDLVEESRSLPRFPVLLDDYQHSFGPSERQPLVSLLNSGSDANGYFARGEEDFSLFSPKAFAGNSPLPPSLAARCIPIRLRRPKPSEKFIRYWTDGDRGEFVETLRHRLRQWLDQISSALVEAARHLPPDLPPALSPGQSNCAEPLVHIADVAGGHWPRKIRAALVAVFDLAEAGPELQMLSDLRAIFHHSNNPEYLATSDLLSQLRALDNRPWSAWPSNSGRRLAFHLRPFAIASRRLYFGSEDGFMGYLLQDFHDAWERYLPQMIASDHLEHQTAIASDPLDRQTTIAGDQLGASNDDRLQQTAFPQECSPLPPVLPPVEFP
jgi:putative DNA primase/helicase